MFNFPKTPRTIGLQFYPNLLKSVTFQVKYPKNEGLLKAEAIWRERLQSRLPNSKKVMHGQVRFTITEKTPIIQPPTSANIGFELRSKDSKEVLIVTEDALTLTIMGKAYSNFNDVFGSIERDFYPLLNETHISEFNRVAIRKINIIEFSPAEKCSVPEALASIFNETLVHNLIFMPSQDTLDSGMTRCTFNAPEFKLNLAYGVLEQKQNTHRQAVLDIDLFKINGFTSIYNLNDVMTQINEEIFNIFNWAIQKELLSSLVTSKVG